LPFELFLQRLNAQGLEISSPWMDTFDGEQLILEEHKEWSAKERWVGCQEMDECVRETWTSTKHCPNQCCKLGQAAQVILTVSQLQGSKAKWLHATELKHRHCDLSKDGDAALDQYLSLAKSRQGFLCQTRNHVSQSTAAPLLVNRRIRAISNDPVTESSEASSKASLKL
jgi:hypothetical protein